MQKFLLLFSLIPFIAVAQLKPSSKKAAPLIESITSDTVKGSCKKIVFEYDKLKRVSSISVKKIEIKKRSENTTSTIEIKIEVQKFHYRQNEQIPFARLIDFYDDETGELILEYQKLEYFLFKDEKRIGDSTIYPGGEQQKEDSELEDKHSPKRVATFVQTQTKVIHILDLSKKNPNTYTPTNIYEDSFAINKDHNIGYESTIHDDGSKFYTRAFFTFTKYDKYINPLHQLNIAPLLSNEKITLSIETTEKVGDDRRSFDWYDLEFNWHYLNKNNPMNYSIERGETQTPLKDMIQFAYTYNQYHQPIYCKIIIKKVMNRNEGHRYDYKARTFKKAFTFRYKQ
jgi:hypothetical protein